MSKSYVNGCMSLVHVKQKMKHKRKQKPPWYMDADNLAEKMKVYDTIGTITGGIFDSAIKVNVKGRKK